MSYHVPDGYVVGCDCRDCKPTRENFDRLRALGVLPPLTAARAAPTTLASTPKPRSRMKGNA